MKDKTAHEKLKEINKSRNEKSVGGYKNSRRQRVERHEKFNEAMTEIQSIENSEV